MVLHEAWRRVTHALSDDCPTNVSPLNATSDLSNIIIHIKSKSLELLVIPKSGDKPFAMMETQDMICVVTIGLYRWS